MKRSRQRVAIFEIGGSHDECILSQVMALREAGCWVVFCGSQDLYLRNVLFKDWFDAFHEVTLPKTMLGDFSAMHNLNKWLKKNEIDVLIANTAQGGHVRNLCVTANRRTRFVGIIHTIKMLQGSFTQRLISRKIKQYFVLNDTLKKAVTPISKGLQIDAFYPLDYPRFDTAVMNKQGFQVTIVGGVEFRRKDLTGFMDFAEKVSKEVHFVFLGKSDVSRTEVQQFVADCEKRGVASNIRFFDDFVDQQTFDAYLRNTDCILPLIHPGTPSADEYFSRQISGAINVAFSYGIPMLIHEEYRNWEDFSRGCLFYNAGSMNAQFELLRTQHKTLKEAISTNPKFEKATQRKHFARVVLGQSD